MKIRFGTKKDKQNFLKLQKEAFPKISLRRMSIYFDMKVKNKEIFIAEDKEKYLGHSCFGKHLISPPFNRSVFGEELAIKKEYQRKGIGTTLRKRLVEYCKKNKIPIIFISTGNYKNNKAIEFNIKNGFKILGKLDNIQPDKEYPYGQIFMGLLVKEWRKK
jgi:GNAT superfamily N-acetyltransferase